MKSTELRSRPRISSVQSPLRTVLRGVAGMSRAKAVEALKRAMTKILSGCRAATVAASMGSDGLGTTGAAIAGEGLFLPSRDAKPALAGGGKKLEAAVAGRIETPLWRRRFSVRPKP